MRLRWLAGTVGLWACSSPILEGTNFNCTTNADCGDGQLCGSVGASRACVALETSPIRVGLSAPLQGPSADLGIEMRRGIEAAFQRVNEEGGVFGRELELTALNDNYDPPTALVNCKELLDVTQEVADADIPDMRGPDSVVALLGNVGTPPMLVTAPLATKNRALFFAPFTGAQRYLRDGTNSPYVYNYRASYYQETEAMVEFMRSVRSPRILGADDPTAYQQILAFIQNDSYGAAGYDGFALAYNKLHGPLPEPSVSADNPSITKVTYEREDVDSVDTAIEGAQLFLENLMSARGTAEPISVGVFMIDTYQPGNKFIRAIKDWINDDLTRASTLDVLFIHVSFVGSDALAQTLTLAPRTYVDITDPSGARTKTYAEGVMVTQVVPNYTSQAQGVRQYRADIDALDNGTYSFNSLEGYIASSLFIEGLRLNGPNISAYETQTLVDTFDTQIVDLDLKIGTLLDFSSTNHQASHTVWGSVIGADGSFTIPFTWNAEAGIMAEQN